MAGISSVGNCDLECPSGYQASAQHLTSYAARLEPGLLDIVKLRIGSDSLIACQHRIITFQSQSHPSCINLRPCLITFERQPDPG